VNARRLTPLVLACLAILWTWPASVAGSEFLVGRHLDLPGTVWFISAADRLIFTLHDPLTAWPTGATHTRLDSWVLLVLSALSGFLDPVRVHALLQVGGVFISAWAAEACARAIGAKAPWSWLAGLSFAFSGLAATALLEGHVYHLVNPWLPGFAWAWWVATGPDGSARQGTLAGGLWVGCLLTSAYTGLAASLVAIGLAIGGLTRRELTPRTVGGALAVVVPAIAIYGALFAAGDLHAGAAADALNRGSANLVNLAGPTAELDRNGNSLSATVHASILALVLVAPVVLRDEARWKALLGTAIAALILACGTVLGTPRTAFFPLPLGLVDAWVGLDFLRFPARLMWAWSLCAGLVAARVATVLAKRQPLATSVLLVVALIDVFWVIQMPGRQRTQIAATPSAYTHAQGAILDLYPEYVGPVGDWNTWFQGLACLYQVGHHQPIVNDCLATDSAADPGQRLAREARRRLLAGESISNLMADWEIDAIAWHPDLFTPGDRRRLAERLLVLDPHPQRSTDGGDHVVLYRRSDS
jgi:hypothetical protein